jgi:NADH-quinone oxidoreductase subunit J
MPLGLFVFLAVLSLISSFGVIAQRNPVHCLLALVVTLMTMGVMFIALDAVTVGFLQIIVYVGAIMVLFLFVIWLLNLQADTGPLGHLALKLFAAVAAAVMVAEIFVFIARTHPMLGSAPVAPGYGEIDKLAATLFGSYLMAFEATSILLLVAVVGAVAIARRATVGDAIEAQKEGRSGVAR